MWALRRASLAFRNQGFSIEASSVLFSNSELVLVKRSLSSFAGESSQPSEKLEEIKEDDATAKNASAGKLIKKLVNFRMKQGKQTRTRAIAYETFHRLARAERNVLDVLVDAVENVKPVCEVEKVGVAGSVYDVPGIVDRDRQETLAIRWILDAASRRRGSYKVSLEKCLVDELLDASRKRGFARKKRDNIHKLAADNRSFAHFRWW